MNVSRDGRFSKMTDSLLAVTGYLKEEIARIAALQVEAEEVEEGTERKISKEEIVQMQAVELLTAAWSVELKKILIAKLYQGM
jgi:G:T/U-mismatch repair DNA glycosylase